MLFRSILEDIKVIREIVNGKPSDKQGLTRNQAEGAIFGDYQLAITNIQRKMVAPGAQEEKLVTNVEKRMTETVNRINEFFAGKWTAYRELVENTKVNLFKDYKPL